MFEIKEDNDLLTNRKMILVAVLVVFIAMFLAAFFGGFSSILANGRTICLDCIGIL